MFFALQMNFMGIFFNVNSHMCGVVPDKRFRFLVEKYKPKSVVPAQLSITDIAGYVHVHVAHRQRNLWSI